MHHCAYGFAHGQDHPTNWELVKLTEGKLPSTEYIENATMLPAAAQHLLYVNQPKVDRLKINRARCI